MNSAVDRWLGSIALAGCIVGCVIALSACSVGMAAAGKESPNLAVCQVGSDKTLIESEVGPPKMIKTFADGSTSCTYEYEVGNEPSTGRAMLNAGMDVVTLGLWEVVGTPAEALKGSKYEMIVVYGPDGKAKEIRTRPLGVFD